MATKRGGLQVHVVEHENGIITAFVARFPGVVVQCNNKEELHQKLDLAWESFVKRLSTKQEFLFEEQSL